MSTVISSDIQSMLNSVNGTTSQKSANSTQAQQDRFLKLLTTQLKNQDPLNPMDNAQMTSQLAQISTVDGIEKLNATLQKMMASTANAEAMQAAALVGHQVMVAGSALQLTEAGAVGGVELKSNSDKVTVTVKDANGLVVRTLELGKLDAGVNNFVWDGKNDAGAAATAGSYTFSVAAAKGTVKVDASALQLASVISINSSTQGVSLDLGDVGLVTMSDIKQIF